MMRQSQSNKNLLNNKINLLLEKKLGVMYFWEWMDRHYGPNSYERIPKRYHEFIKKWFETNQGQTPPKNWEDMVPDDVEIFDLPTPDVESQSPGSVPFAIDIFLPNAVGPWFWGEGNPSAYPENYPDYQFGGNIPPLTPIPNLPGTVQT